MRSEALSMKPILISGTMLMLLCSAQAEQTVVRSIALPGASMDQEVTYSTSQADYESTKNSILKRLQNGDKTAFVNPSDGPWMRVETTAKIGLEIKGIGVAQGRKNLRQITAAEEALFLYERSKDKK
jgi:hypothetical protein